MPKQSGDNVYILITQCLQNGFFLADDNRLCLPHDTVKQMLVGSEAAQREALRTATDKNAVQRRLSSRDDRKILEDDFFEPRDNQRKIKKDILKNGPLYKFLEAVIEKRSDPLHVIQVKDWHQRSDDYDEERRLYGVHCEADSWAAAPIDGLEKYLNPWGDQPRSANTWREIASQNVTYYEVLSNSVFDFRAASGDPKAESHLEQILDRIIAANQDKRVYMVVIGVYTDIKIELLLAGLRSHYHIKNLIVSDVLTGAPTLERHLAALDFIDKVLNIEIVHNLGDLAGVLNPASKTTISQQALKDSINFREYRTYFQDKQNLLAFQDHKLAEYIELTRKRGDEVYNRIKNANLILMWFGYIFLGLTVLFGVLKFLAPDAFPTDILIVTGGLSVLQLVAVFFTNPMNQMQKNLTNLVRLRNYMETYSSLTAIMRHHFTTSDSMQLKTDREQASAEKRIKLAGEQIKLIESAAREMSDIFRDIPLPSQELKEEETSSADQS